MLRISLVVAMLAVFVAAASAAPVPCVQTTLNNYISLTEGCIIGDKVFSDFTYSAVIVQGSGVTPAATGVTVTPLPTPDLNPGINFQSVWQAGAGSIIDVQIGFNVATLTGAPLIKDASLSIFGLSGGTLGGGEDLCLGDTWTNACASGVQWTGQLQSPASGGSRDTSWYSEPGPVSLVGVRKDISLIAGSGTAEFSIIEERFSQVPEPGTLLLMGGGLLALGLVRRRVRG